MELDGINTVCDMSTLCIASSETSWHTNFFSFFLNIFLLGQGIYMSKYNIGKE